MKLRHAVVLLLIILLPLAAAADTDQDPMVSGVVLNVSYDGSVVVKVDIRAEVFLLYGVRFPEPQDSIWQEARRLCRKMVMNKSVTIEPMGHDRWGRKLGRIYVGDLCLNDELLDKGYARPQASLEQAAY
jgi:micrococcal nuclease